MFNKLKSSQHIKQISKDLGFDYCGIAKAEKLDEDARRLEQWLSKSRHGHLQYLERNFDLRTDPTLLVPGAKSVITLLLNYYPSEKQNTNSPKISKYAYGIDYHFVIRDKLNQFLARITEEIGTIDGRGFVDSAPVLEKSWAQRSGLGWVGKNGLLITKSSGSFFFLATLIIDMELEYDDPFAKDFCGTCTKCIDACPTNAILPNKEIQANQCISYFTIEIKDEIMPYTQKENFKNWMFGCDICQDVCPWNRFSTPNNTEGLNPYPEILNFTTKEWESLTVEVFNKVFKNSPLKRSKFTGIMRNLKFITE
ncbi:MAG: tRNA epoxyqueuosine(34) reductase QueG [Chitinophagaceae bacterium]|nr:MAG: tRNA epoxyqueuosine(34) reductase QueG [Chitinophagaceae bacterium]